MIVYVHVGGAYDSVLPVGLWRDSNLHMQSF